MDYVRCRPKCNLNLQQVIQFNPQKKPHPQPTEFRCLQNPPRLHLFPPVTAPRNNNKSSFGRSPQTSSQPNNFPICARQLSQTGHLRSKTSTPAVIAANIPARRVPSLSPSKNCREKSASGKKPQLDCGLSHFSTNPAHIIGNFNHRRVSRLSIILNNSFNLIVSQFYQSFHQQIRPPISAKQSIPPKNQHYPTAKYQQKPSTASPLVSIPASISIVIPCCLFPVKRPALNRRRTAILRQN